MNQEYRRYIYAFLSRVYSDIPDRKFIEDLKSNRELLELIGQESLQWFENESLETLYNELNSDFSSMFVINTQPVESFILDAKNETLVGLQNPVMAFYFNHSFELDMNQTEIVAPDHISIEFAFMQTLVFRQEYQPQIDFLREHLIIWVVPYMFGMKNMAQTPFYRELSDFVAEFLIADYETVLEVIENGTK